MIPYITKKFGGRHKFSEFACYITVFGGLYLDWDEVILRSVDSLRDNPMTMVGTYFLAQHIRQSDIWAQGQKLLSDIVVLTLWSTCLALVVYDVT